MLAELSIDLKDLSDRLDEIASGGTHRSFAIDERKPDPRKLIKAARMLYQMRRIRERKLVSDLFGEPAWDMLLDLFIADLEGKRLQVTSVCIGAAVPSTTALRWIGVLLDHGLVQRENDPGDARRAYVTLSPLGQRKMVEIVDSFASQFR